MNNTEQLRDVLHPHSNRLKEVVLMNSYEILMIILTFALVLIHVIDSMKHKK